MKWLFDAGGDRTWPIERIRTFDVTIIVVLALATAAYVAPFVDVRWQIYEDAAMLFRYAQHVSAGHGIVWNIGDPPVDGATDLLFMWMIAGLNRLGVGIETAARVIGTVAHLATIVLIFVGARTLGAAGRTAALLSSTYVAIGPAKVYIAGGFGTTVFAACVALAWFTCLRLAAKPGMRRAVACGCAFVLMGVARPEGALLAIYSAIALALFWTRDPGGRFLWPLVLTGAALGGAYWFWRWSYFGYPLPNPFYRKGNGHLYYGNLLITAKYGALHLGVFLVPMILGLADRRTRRMALLGSLPILAFLASWILLSNEMNFFRRFQYPVVPIAAMSWALWIPARSARWRAALSRGPVYRRAGFAAIAVAVVISALAYQHRRYTPPRWQDRLFEAGLDLERYRDRGYTMAVSEAGLLPFYSQWRTIDAWGLNDQWIAHHGVVSATYLDAQRPDLIMFRAQCRPTAPGDPDPWTAMVGVLTTYVRDRSYEPSAVMRLGDGSLTLFYVRRELEDRRDIDAILRRRLQHDQDDSPSLPDCGAVGAS